MVVPLRLINVNMPDIDYKLLRPPAIIEINRDSSNIADIVLQFSEQQNPSNNPYYTKILNELETAIEKSRIVAFPSNDRKGFFEFRVKPEDDDILACFVYAVSDNNTHKLKTIVYLRKSGHALIIKYKGNDWRNVNDIIGIEEDSSGDYRREFMEIYDSYRQIEKQKRQRAPKAIVLI